MQTNVCTKNAVKKEGNKKVKMFKLKEFKCLNSKMEDNVFSEPQKALDALKEGVAVVASGKLEEYNGKKDVSVTTASIVDIKIFDKCVHIETGRFIYKVKI